MVFGAGGLGSGLPSGGLAVCLGCHFPPWTWPLSPTHRLVVWLLHRLQMALPQPVLRGKAGEQVGAGLGEGGPDGGRSGMAGLSQGGHDTEGRRVPATGAQPTQPACLPCPAILHSLRHHVCEVEGAGSALPERGHSRWGRCYHGGAERMWGAEEEPPGSMTEGFPVEVACELSPEV